MRTQCSRWYLYTSIIWFSQSLFEMVHDLVFIKLWECWARDHDLNSLPLHSSIVLLAKKKWSLWITCDGWIYFAARFYWNDQFCFDYPLLLLILDNIEEIPSYLTAEIKDRRTSSPRALASSLCFRREDIRFAESRLSVPGSRDLYTWGGSWGSKYYGWAFRKRGQWIFTSIRQLWEAE